jgi:transcriptional regulator with XRE-family HTH domain
MPKKSDVYEQLSLSDKTRVEDWGQRIRFARQRRGWTQAELAEKSGMSVGTVKHIEAGHCQVPLGFWVKLMEVFYLSHEFENLAQPENDTLGASLEIRKPILRVRKRQDASLDQSLDLDI